MPTAISVSGGTAKSRGDRPKTLFSVDRRARMERVERKGKGDVVDRILETMIRATLDDHITDVVPPLRLPRYPREKFGPLPMS